MIISEIQTLSEAHRQAGVALSLGLASACAFAVSNSLQHRVAGTVPPTIHRPPDVLRHLAGKPVWLAATLVSFVAMLLHAFALRTGSIALVQPLMLVGVVLAVPMRAALERAVPPWNEVKAVLVTVGGLAVFIRYANPVPATTPPHLTTAFVLVLIGLAAAIGALGACRSSRAQDPRVQAALLGTAAGVLFGVTAGLLKLVGTAVATGGVRLDLLVLLVLCLIGLGLLGTAVNQRAYQIAPIAFSMPIVNVVDVLVAVGFGAIVFNELPGHGPGSLVVQLAALGCVAVGLRGIAHLECAAKTSERPLVATGSRR